MDMLANCDSLYSGPLFGEAGEPDPPPFPEKPTPTEPTVEPPKPGPDVMPPKDPPSTKPGRGIEYPSPDLPDRREVDQPIRRGYSAAAR